ncbi:hypothetical protein B0T26DRAFT_866405 [Lasiosphaeria miniovina]|uniref:Uncharacterized protein n=1 Tax=Lasiosphaeria miniovina TaxID=1954250 RepID=A0AA40BEZ9_9PEZI|nr:uncharacterized protein B0T26DRAFT_866405 [Lasiosphaeria miniovina]KAK0733035.1 hypothetical protein B0T26DRAFT_866405 [Lasiosphaeria miniovina]
MPRKVERDDAFGFLYYSFLRYCWARLPGIARRRQKRRRTIAGLPPRRASVSARPSPPPSPPPLPLLLPFRPPRLPLARSASPASRNSAPPPIAMSRSPPPPPPIAGPLSLRSLAPPPPASQQLSAPLIAPPRRPLLRQSYRKISYLMRSRTVLPPAGEYLSYDRTVRGRNRGYSFVTLCSLCAYQARGCDPRPEST